MAQAFTLEILRHSGAAPRPPSGLALLMRLEAWLDRRAECRAALSLDDRTLADLGLSRADAQRAYLGAPLVARTSR